MIRASALRLGNLFQTETYVLKRVESLAHNEINGVPQQRRYPVPITEDILCSFGFVRKKYAGNYWFEKTRNGFRFVTNDINPENPESAFSGKLKFVMILIEHQERRIRYVHDLQNTWKELTRTELVSELGK